MISIEACQNDSLTNINDISVDRNESPENNIYGTKDYYDYYTRLRP